MYKHMTPTPESQVSVAIPVWSSTLPIQTSKLRKLSLLRLEDPVILDTFFWVTKMSGNAVGLAFKIALVST